MPRDLPQHLAATSSPGRTAPWTASSHQRISDHPVYLLRRGKPVAVLVDADKYERLIDHIEDLEDTLAVLRARANS